MVSFSLQFALLGLATIVVSSQVIVTEIMRNPRKVSHEKGEWFELYNDGAAEVNLIGWRFADDYRESVRIRSDLIIPSKGRIVLGNNFNSNTNGGVRVNYAYNSRRLIFRRRDALNVYNADNRRVDRVNWAKGGFPTQNGAAIALKDINLNNNVGANWCFSTTPYGLGDKGTPGLANDCGAVPSAPTRQTRPPTKAPVVPPIAPKAPVVPPIAPMAPVVPPTAPKAPVVAPMAPVVAPMAPVVAPMAPVAAPMTPVAAPMTPVAAPVTPVAAPMTPVAAPMTPVAAPMTPVAAPMTPVAAPMIPVAAPVTPVTAPTTPVAAPKTPVAAPSAPVSAPSAPVTAPSAPVTAPTAPVAAPSAPSSPASPGSVPTAPN